MCSIIAQCQSHSVIEEEENLFKSQSQAHWGRRGGGGKREGQRNGEVEGRGGREIFDSSPILMC